ncbi:MAG: hypothetical protein EA401_13535 [Planctomycetota bacterium]|nr:MAG: hypothetical protein EA401_13535 [Planctomycetota bacterium]
MSYCCMRTVSAFLMVGILGLLLTGFPSPLTAVEDDFLTSEEMDDRSRERRREAAASFRVQYRAVRENLPENYQARAAAAFARTKELFTEGDFRRALRQGRRAYRSYRFADVAPEQAHLMMRIYAATGSPLRARDWLIDLWERYPGYPHIDQAMREALISARAMSRQGMSINLEAERPQDVVDVHDLRLVLAANDLFRFLAVHGDRQEVAPVANLGLARSLLARGGRRHTANARNAYADFLHTYPKHPLVFEALMEMSISHLVDYRGPRFDVGVLIDAAHIIDQAELYTEDQPERVEVVRTYRRQIRRWHQDRDLYAAEWYREHREWDASRYYYQWVVRREATSDQGLKAQRALDELPQGDDDAPRMRIIDWLRK